MSPLGPEDFDAFFAEVNGYLPFPWQRRLAAQVVRDGAFPAALDLPTGSGKTAAIDIAVFGLAADLSKGPQRLPSRVGFVVDRRTVVDQSYARACRLAEKLRQSTPGSVAHRVAEQLREQAGTDEPLHVALLRGAMPRDDTWVSNPVQPTVLVSTVDQVGSRLLFRGYGVSEGMRPVHAGLLGNDLLLMLDEVHVARPFCDTLRMLEKFHRGRIGADLPRRFQVVELSATHRERAARVYFHLDDSDRQNGRLRRRLVARKPATLESVNVTGKEPARLKALAKCMAERAVEAAHSGRAVGVVVNRVQTARLIYSDIAARGLHADVWLLTGRMRPLDRQALERDLQTRLGMGRDRITPARTAVLVATQCIEAGADFDFDALVTECASLDALRQRFGRLNRAGDIDDATATVFARSDIGAYDPIYGTSAAATWAYLSEQGPLDFGAESLPMPQGSALERLLSPSQSSPILLPAHLDAWAQTSPAPGADPEVARWLHGSENNSGDVLVVWRADVGEDELRAASETQAGHEAPMPRQTLSSLRERIDACPPLTSEALAVPVWAVQSWLLARSADEESLVGDAGRDAAANGVEGDGESRLVIVMRGSEYLVVDAKRLRPWDVLIAPAIYGGIRAGNWDSGATEPVCDLAELAHLRQRGRAVLRLDERLWLGKRPPIPSEMDDGADDVAEIRAFLEDNAEHTSDDEGLAQDRTTIIRALLSDLERRPGPRLIRVSGSDLRDRWTLVARGPVRARTIPGLVSSDLAFEEEELSFIGNAATLRTHLAGVGRIAEAFARRCGLSEDLVKDLRLAGELHDLGKCDPRFQLLLHSGSEYRALTAPEPLAKSPVSARNRRVQAEARRLADYPVGTRHELLSLALLKDADHLEERAHDWELVLFLVSSHHGYCRPFAPVELAPHGDPVEVVMEYEGRPLRASSDHHLAAIDSGVPDRFFSLVERFGCHGLAWLEAILRLADHRRSEQEAKGS